QPILVNAAPTDQEIALDEIRLRPGKPLTYTQLKRTGVMQGVMGVAFFAASVTMLLLRQQPGSSFSDTTASMFVFYALIMIMSSASTFRAALTKKKDAEGMQTPAQAKVGRYLKHLVTACTVAVALFIGVFVVDGIRSEFSDLTQGRRYAARG